MVPKMDIGKISRAPKSSLNASNAFSILLDLLGILVIDVHYVVVGAVAGFKEFIKLRVNGLGVPVFGPLNDQRHSPGGKCGE